MTRVKLAAHPWGQELNQYVHLGWPGGANNSHRVDWHPIINLPREVKVVVACDNDQVGKEAARAISRILKRPLKVLHFDDRFPVAFDLADKWPVRIDWWHGKRYTRAATGKHAAPRHMGHQASALHPQERQAAY